MSAPRPMGRAERDALRDMLRAGIPLHDLRRATGRGIRTLRVLLWRPVDAWRG